MDLGFKIDEGQIKGLVAEGLLAQLTGEAREEILKQAVVQLITGPKDNYWRQQVSPLQAAFNDAARLAMNEIVREMVLDNEEYKAKIREGIAAAIESAASNHYDLQAKLGAAIGQVITEGWRSYRD